MSNNIHRIKRFNESAGENNYMFFNGLKNIKKMVDDLLELDPETVDKLLNEHDWASNHIASSLDDITEVYQFMQANASSRPSNYIEFDENNEI